MAKINKVNKYTVLRHESEDESLPLVIQEFAQDLKEESWVDLKNTVLADTREQKGWWFKETDFIKETKKGTLKTGDYSLVGLEDKFVIERKGSTAEFSQNILQQRFENEMNRLEEFEYPYVILEFDYQDLLDFPINSGIPPKLWGKVKLRGKFLISALMRYQAQYKTKFILAGSNGMEAAEALFKAVVRNVNNSIR